MRPTKAHPRLIPRPFPQPLGFGRPWWRPKPVREGFGKSNGSKAHVHAQPHHPSPYFLGHFECDTEQRDADELEAAAAPEAVCTSPALPPTPDKVKESLSSVRSPITTTTSEYIRAEDSSPVRLGPNLSHFGVPLCIADNEADDLPCRHVRYPIHVL